MPAKPGRAGGSSELAPAWLAWLASAGLAGSGLAGVAGVAGVGLLSRQSRLACVEWPRPTLRAGQRRRRRWGRQERSGVKKVGLFARASSQKCGKKTIKGRGPAGFGK